MLWAMGFEDIVLSGRSPRGQTLGDCLAEDGPVQFVARRGGCQQLGALGSHVHLEMGHTAVG